jgi:DNA polymerase-3 subunit alpha
MASLLTSERANTEKMVEYLEEARQMGIEVLPPDLNASDIFFSVQGGAIRFGLAAIKNVGEGAVQAALRVREDGPFRSLHDFCERVDMKAVNRRVVESFIKSGCFDSLTKRRAALFAAIDAAMDAGQKRQRDHEQGQASLLGLLGGPPDLAGAGRLPEAPDWGEAERLGFEKESLGFFITGHPLERYRAELQQLCNCTTLRLLELRDAKEVALGGIIGALRLIKTKKGDRMASFLLEDLEGTAEALVFPETYKKLAGRLADDQLVLVKAKAEPVEEGKARLLVTDVVPLDQARLSETRFVTIRVALDRWDRSKGERLREILDSHRGECPVRLELGKGGSFAVQVEPSAYFRVKPDARFEAEVEALFGKQALVLSRGALPRG